MFFDRIKSSFMPRNRAKVSGKLELIKVRGSECVCVCVCVCVRERERERERESEKNELQFDE